MMKNTFLKVIICLSVAFLFFASNLANSYNGEAFYYAKESINAFNTVKLGVLATNKTVQSEARTMLANNMKNLIKQRNAIKQAQATFDGFKTSKEKTIQASVALISGSLGMLAINMDTMIDLIANGLTMRDAYDYDVKKAHMEDLEPGKFLEMALLEFEYQHFEREIKLLSSNYNFVRDDDFYGG